MELVLFKKQYRIRIWKDTNDNIIGEVIANGMAALCKNEELVKFLNDIGINDDNWEDYLVKKLDTK